MAGQSFGGVWTDEKLTRLRKYLVAYRQIFSGNPAARYFRTWYVDAFAGAGTQPPPSPPETGQVRLLDESYSDVESREYRSGSPKIALSLEDSFDRYLFIESDKGQLSELKKLVDRDYPEKSARCEFRHGDANRVLKTWCDERDWSKERAVVFLDPYGMQVEWSTIESLAASKAIDLWYLFPLGIGVLRLLTRTGDIDERWTSRLDALFGTHEWRTEFYKKPTQARLFPDGATVARTVTPEAVMNFLEARLNRCFAGVAHGLILRNSKSNPLYCLCFAAANERGAKPALKIARDILKR
jgi:three-Cys-motif partner protein